jgi:hypothetical protein
MPRPNSSRGPLTRVPRDVSRPFETQLVIHCPPQHVATVLERVPWSLTASPESTNDDAVLTTDWLENRAYEADDLAPLRELTREFGCGSRFAPRRWVIASSSRRRPRVKRRPRTLPSSPCGPHWTLHRTSWRTEVPGVLRARPAVGYPEQRTGATPRPHGEPWPA